MASDSFCQRFTHSSQQIQDLLPSFEEQFQQMMGTASDTELAQFAERMDGLRETKQEFDKEYQERVKEMLGKWAYPYILPTNPIRETIKPHVKFEADGRVVYDTDIDTGQISERSYFPNIIRKVLGSVSFTGGINSYDYLEEIEGDLTMSTMGNRSAQRLHRVGKNLDLGGGKSSLPSLSYVGGDVSAREGYFSFEKSQTAMPHLTYIGGSIDIIQTEITDISQLEYIGDYLYIRKVQMPLVFGSLTTVEGDVHLNTVDFSDLRQVFPKLQKVGVNRQNGASFRVSSRDLFAQIEDLKKAGELDYDGTLVLERELRI